MRVFAVSDLHVDYRANLEWVRRLSAAETLDDVLLVPGDVSHRLDRLERALEMLRARFARVFYVPGNHEAWLRGDDPREASDSLLKLRRVRDICERVGVETEAARVGSDVGGVWIVPLFGWYEGPDEGTTSLYVKKRGEDPTLSMWTDRWAVRWPDFGAGLTATDVLLGFNETSLPARGGDSAPVITFSHFLPRRELIFPTPEELAAWAGRMVDPMPAFNFSRVAGTRRLDDQLRALGSIVHVYGHQHRNREMILDGVRYVSFGLGSPRERVLGRTRGVGTSPKLIFDEDASAVSAVMG